MNRLQNMIQRSAAILFLAVLLGSFFAAPANADQWISGPMSYQAGIDGYGNQHIYVTSTLSYYGAPDHSSPRVGERYWADIFIAVPGQAAVQYAVVASDIALPPNTQFAVDATNKVKCYFYPAGWQPGQTPLDYSNNATYCGPGHERGHSGLGSQGTEYPVPKLSLGTIGGAQGAPYNILRARLESLCHH